MSCCNGLCSCYLEGLRDGFNVGFHVGRKVGRMEGYVSGYVDATLGIEPPAYLRPAIQKRLDDPYRLLGPATPSLLSWPISFRCHKARCDTVMGCICDR